MSVRSAEQSRRVVCVLLLLSSGLLLQAPLRAQREGRGGPPQPPATPRAAAPMDLTGYWVSLVTEDWRHRQFVPPKGDYGSVPLTPAARKLAGRWDAARDEAAGEQCRAYGAAGLMRMPTRLRITWRDDTTLKLETDAGTQTRLLQFGPASGQGDSSGGWQGVSTASWEFPRAPFAGRGGGPSAGGSLKVTTTKMRPGYLLRNGVPYSSNAVLTEYLYRLDVPGGDSLLLVTSEVVDPEYLATPFWTSVQFKRLPDASGWNPTPCAAR